MRRQSRIFDGHGYETLVTDIHDWWCLAYSFIFPHFSNPLCIQRFFCFVSRRVYIGCRDPALSREMVVLIQIIEKQPPFRYRVCQKMYSQSQYLIILKSMARITAEGYQCLSIICSSKPFVFISYFLETYNLKTGTLYPIIQQVASLYSLDDFSIRGDVRKRGSFGWRRRPPPPQLLYKTLLGVTVILFA